MARQNKAEIVLTAKDRTKRAFSAVNKSLGRFAAIGLAGGVAGLALLTRAGLKQIDALAKQSQLLGITTEKLAAFQLVAAKTGIEQKTLEKSLINVTRVVAEAAEGTGLATDTLKKLGLEAVTLARLSPDEQFREIADAMQGLNTQSEKVLAAYELFGGRGAALLRTLEAGSAGFEEAEEKTRRFGTAISAVDARSIEDANDSFTDLAESVKGLGFSLARRFSPGMDSASQSAANFIVSIRTDFIPAMALLLEQLDLVVASVRGLTDIELAVRVEFGADELAKAEREEQEFLARRSTARALAESEDNKFKVTFGAKARTQKRIAELAAEREAVEERLAEVVSEQERRAAFILDADRKLEEMRAAQREETRVAAEQAEEEAEKERSDKAFDRELVDAERSIALSIRLSKDRGRILEQEGRDRVTAAINAQRLEQQVAVQVIRLRQATAATVVGIAQALVGKNKRAAQALFIVEKGLAIARVIQNTAAGAVKAFADLPFPVAVTAAASIKAFGAAQIGLIAATALTGVGAIGGGGVPGGIGAGGGFGAGDFSGGIAANDPTPSSGGTALQSQGVVQLIFPNLFGITPEAIDALADALREASENRDVIIVSGQGRNAEILAGTNG